MTEKHRRLTLGEPARYQIQVHGRLQDAWSDHFAGMTLSTTESGVTTLEGMVQDQPALFGLLLQIRDLGLPLLLVQCLEENSPASDESPHS